MAQPIWNTPSGSLGNFPSGISLTITLLASPVFPATTISYILLSGELPKELDLNNSGIITGTPPIVPKDLSYTFSVRAIDNLGNLRDRTFTLTVSGAAAPQFTTPEGQLMTVQDSTWVELPVQYSNPNSNNPVYIEVKEGILPPGLEINERGIIRGYAHPPVINTTAPSVSTSVTISNVDTNIFNCVSTTGFYVGRPIIFTGVVFGGVIANTTYYIHSVINSNAFTISDTQFGPVLVLPAQVGFMTATLPSITIGQPTIRTYSFALRLVSPLGNDLVQYSITVVNQNTPVISGGPGLLPNTRIPTILNTRPLSFNIEKTDAENFGYYVVPPKNSNQLTIPPATAADIGRTDSGNYFSFRILGHDFDGTPLTYQFLGLPGFVTGNATTGWITGNPALAPESISRYTFSVCVYKTNNSVVISEYFTFSLIVSNDILGTVVWVSPANLGTIYNSNISTFKVQANSDVALNYRLSSGSLPPNLTLLDNGEITGRVAFQPTSTELSTGTDTDFTFTVQAYSPTYPLILSSKQFTINVYQRYSSPIDTLYIKATPSFEDRAIIANLLNNSAIIPDSAIYRPTDIYFGKATNVVYEHAYGIYASDIDQYIASVTQNHYGRAITLGEIKTAIAKNSSGEIIYEVVYSEIFDNLVNPQGESIPETIIWPRPIPGSTRVLHPNSLYNMRNRVGQVLGQEYDSNILPLWMTSQQENGSTLGYTQAWVICYTKPGYSKIIANNIKNKWVDPIGNNYVLNDINFQIDRFTVDKSITYNYDNLGDPPGWDALPSATPTPNPLDSEDFYALFPRKTILPE